MIVKWTTKGDIYTMGAIPDVGDLKGSVHPDGKAQLQIERKGVVKGSRAESPFWEKAETMNPTERWAGRRRVASRTFDPGFTVWDPEPPGPSTQTVLEIDDSVVRDLPGWTVDVWALEPQRPELVEECRALFPVVLGAAHDAGTVPELLAVAWTMEPVEWDEIAWEKGELHPTPGAYHVTRSLDGVYTVLRADVPLDI